MNEKNGNQYGNFQKMCYDVKKKTNREVKPWNG